MSVLDGYIWLFMVVEVSSDSVDELYANVGDAYYVEY